MCAVALTCEFIAQKGAFVLGIDQSQKCIIKLVILNQISKAVKVV